MNDYKDLLFTDICARLKYNVKAKYQCFHIHSVQGLTKAGLVILSNETNKLITTDIKNIRLFLFPLSSMTEEQKIEYRKVCELDTEILSKHPMDETPFPALYNSQDWLNAHHFDYRGLINKGLAIDCTNLNIY